MMDRKAETVATYNRSASGLAGKFNGWGARVEDIETAFALVSGQDPNVLEIGCGNGRDAAEITRRTSRYLGLDISEGLLRIAREQVPDGHFELADIEAYALPDGLDLVFAFASLIHVPRESLRGILARLLAALNPGGVVRISMKRADAYRELTKEDEFGNRTYYLYSAGDIRDLARGFEVLACEEVAVRGQDWLEVTLRKPR